MCGEERPEALIRDSNPRGTLNAYMIDIGAYANLRKLEGRFTEIDISAPDARERCRNAPVLHGTTLAQFYYAQRANKVVHIVLSDFVNNEVSLSDQSRGGLL